MSVMDKLDSFTPVSNYSEPAPPPAEDLGVIDYGVDIVRGMAGGIVDAGNEIIGIKDIFSDEPQQRYLPEIKTKTKAGEVANLVSQIGIGIVGAGKFVKALQFAAGASKAAKVAGGLSKVKQITPLVPTSTGGKFAQRMAEGAIADFAVFGENEERLSNLVQSVPEFRNPLTEFLASDINDSKAEVRLKNVIEGIFMGAAFESVFYGAKLARAAIKGEPKDVKKALDEGADAIENAKLREEGAASPDIDAQPIDEPNPLKPDEPKPELTPAEIDEFSASMKNPDDYDYHTFIKSTIPDKYKQAVDDYSNSLLGDMEYYIGIGQNADNAFNLALGSNQRMAKFISKTSDDKLITLVADAVHAKVTPKLKASFGDMKKGVENLGDMGMIDSLGKNTLLTLQGDKEVVTLLHERLFLYRMQTAVLARKFEGMLKSRLNGEQVKGFDDFFYKFAQHLGDTQEIISGIGRTLGSLRIDSNPKTIKKITNHKPKKTAAELAEADRFKEGFKYLVNEVQQKEASRITPEKVKAIHEMMKEGADPQSVNAMMLMNNVFDSNSNASIRMVADMTKKEYAGKSVWKLFINSLLSSPASQVFNTVSSAIKLVTYPIVPLMGGAMSGNVESIRYGARLYAGYVSAFKDSLKMAKLSLMDGKSFIAPDMEMPAIKSDRIATDIRNMYIRDMGVTQLPPYIETVTKWMGGIGAGIQSPMRLMGASDEFFKQMAYRSKVYADAVEDAVIGNMADKATYAQMMIEKSMLNGEALDEAARRHALSMTWNQELKDEGLISNAAMHMSKTRALRPFAPFIKTPTNLIHDIIAHSPFAPVTKAFKEAKNDPQLWAEAQGKVAFGQFLSFGGLMLAAEGKITGAYPKDAEDKAAWQAAGKLPYSFRVGDKYIPFNRLDPFGSFFGVAADLFDMSVRADEEGSKEEQDAALMLITSVIKNMTGKTYVSGLVDALEVLTDPESKKASFVIQNLAQGLVPFSAGLRFTARQLDPTMKEVGGFEDKVKAGMPFFSDSIPDRYSWITGKQINSSYFWSDAKDDAVLNELSKYSKQISEVRPSKKMFGIELTAEQFSELSRLNGTLKIGGRTMYDELEQLFESSRYQQADSESKDYRGSTQRAYLISEIMQRYKKAAIDQFKRTNTQMNTSIKEMERRKRALPRGGSNTINISKL